MSVTAERVQVLATGGATVRTVESAVRRFLTSRHFVESDSRRAQRTILLQRQGKWVAIEDSAAGDGPEIAAAASLATQGPALSLQFSGSSAVAARFFEAGRPFTGHSGPWSALLSRKDAAGIRRMIAGGPESTAESIARLAAAVGIAPENALPRVREAGLADARQLHFRLPDWAAIKTASGPPLLTDGGYPGYTLHLRAGEQWSFDTGTYCGNEGGPLRGLEVRIQGQLVLKRLLVVHQVQFGSPGAPSDAVKFPAGPLRRAFQVEAFELGPGWGLPPDGHSEDWYSVFNRELRRQSFAQQHSRRIVTASITGKAAAPCHGVIEIVLTPLENPAGSIAFPIHVVVK